MKKFFEYLIKLYKKISADEMFLRASGVSFYILVAFFPFVLIVFLLGTLISEKVSRAILDALTLLPNDIEKIISELVTNTHTSGVLILVLICISIWTLSAALATISKSFNVFYGVKETRNPVLHRISAVIWAVLMLALIIAVMVLIVFENYITDMAEYYFNIKTGGFWYELFGLVMLFFAIVSAMALMYRFIPNIKLKFKHVIKGALIATGIWGLSSYGFAVYINNFSSYHILYGSIAGIVILITWIYITSSVLLLGGEINSMHQKKEDAV